MASWRLESVQNLGRAFRACPGFGDEQGVSAPVETGANVGELLQVEIRRQDIDGGRAAADDHAPGHRPSARVHPRPRGSSGCCSQAFTNIGMLYSFLPASTTVFT